MDKPFSAGEYALELNTYLESKIPNVPFHTRQEIVEYVTYKAIIAISDCISQNDRDWRKAVRTNRKHCMEE